MKTLKIICLFLLVLCACPQHVQPSPPPQPPPPNPVVDEDADKHDLQEDALAGVLNSGDAGDVSVDDAPVPDDDDATWLATVDGDKAFASEAEPPPKPPSPVPASSPPACTQPPNVASHAAPDAHAADQDFATYTDCNGLVEPDKTPSINKGAGNGVLYTAIKAAYYAEHGWVTQADRDMFVALVDSLRVAPGEGRINRNPPRGLHDDQEGADDYVGLVAAAHMLGGSAQIVAHQVWEYGDHNTWTYPNTPENAGWHAFLGRPWWVAHFSYCAGEPADDVSAAAWGAKMALGAKNGAEHANDVLLEWLMIHCLPASASVAAKAGAALWIHKFRKNWKGGIGEVMAKYLNNEEHPEQHPLVKYAPPKDDLVEFHGIKAIFEFILGILLSEGVALLDTTVVALQKLEKLAVKEAAQVVARAYDAAKVIATKVAAVARTAETKLAGVEHSLSAEKIEAKLKALGATVDHPIVIVLRDGPKDMEHPVVVAVHHVEAPLQHMGGVVVHDLRKWAHWHHH